MGVHAWTLPHVWNYNTLFITDNYFARGCPRSEKRVPKQKKQRWLCSFGLFLGAMWISTHSTSPQLTQENENLLHK
jgi:hypothetical protein